MENMKLLERRVAPSRARGLKHLQRCIPPYFTCVAPSRARGLKLNFASVIARIAMSRHHVRVD